MLNEENSLLISWFEAVFNEVNDSGPKYIRYYNSTKNQSLIIIQLWDQQPWHDIIIAQPIWYEECLTFVRLFLQWLHQKCHYFYKKVSLVLWNISTWQVGSRVLVCKFWTMSILFDEISSSNYLQLAFIFVDSDALINRLSKKDLNPQNKGYLKFINSPGF